MNLAAPAFVAQMPPAIAALLALAVLLASARRLWAFARAPAAQRPRAWRLALLLLLQAAGALLLYRTLVPPTLRAPAGLLVVSTAQADRVAATERPAGATVVALPEAPASAGAIRAPDLATALRRHPGTTRLRVLGAGLPARDLDAARGLAVEFRPAPPPRGLVALSPPAAVHAGRAFAVNGRALGVPGGTVELLDPAGARVTRGSLAPDGGFRLAATARVPGPATWRLRLRDRAGKPVEDTPLPLDVAPGAPLRVLLLAGAPTPELKYLRRWMRDAGLDADARIALGGGVEIGDAAARLDEKSLAAYDLVVLDARAWQALGARRASLLRAVDAGLGLLLQLPRATSASERAGLRRLGFATTVERTRDVALPDAAKDDATLVRGPLRIAGDGAVPLLRDAGGEPLAWWRAHGLGRIGIATFDDSYRLVLAGHGARHGDLWATLFSTLPRPRADTGVHIGDDPRVGERVALCRLNAPASVDAPDGARIRLHVDPASGAGACAGLWPQSPGWHQLRMGDVRQRFHVRAADEAPGLRAARLREATARLAASAPAVSAGSPGPAVAGPRWPWFLAWLAVAAAGWWFERARLGRAAPPAG
ncbi:MAG TPA: carboxypeptidase regulatory-like domain-containing protein [Xanthomonadaceae bacterium]|nr:carboxypeptidase regulatory-like domain-containing protein [Xanthomonadaceae bacterium]